MKEIGGYFGFEKLNGKALHSDNLGLNCARSALLFLLRARSIKKLYLPYFLCACVAEMCGRFSFNVEYYHIDEHFRPLFSKTPAKNEYIYIVNYYGTLSSIDIQELKRKYCNIIIDNVQAYFSEPVIGVDTIYSCRKYFGVPDGAWLASDERSELTILPPEGAYSRLAHLVGRIEKDASSFYSDFKTSDDSFLKSELCAMSPITLNILSAIDYSAVAEARINNWQYLNSVMKRYNILQLPVNEGPFCYALLTEKHGIGNTVRKKLAEQRIYIPKLWPDIPAESSECEKRFAEDILPIPCDQRYDVSDMEYIAEAIEEFI